MLDSQVKKHGLGDGRFILLADRTQFDQPSNRGSLEQASPLLRGGGCGEAADGEVDRL